MKKLKLLRKTNSIPFLIFLISHTVFSQNNPYSSWQIEASSIDPTNYYGVTMANGMIGLVSSPEPMKVKDVVLNGIYDHYERGRVSNILKTFSHLNLDIEVEGDRVEVHERTDMKQVLDMKQALLQTSFVVPGKLKVDHKLMSLRNLPFTSLAIVEFEALADVEVISINTMEAPNHLKDVRNLYSEIDRPHALIPLMTSVAESPSGKHTLAASTSFIFEEDLHAQPDIIHEDWDYNRHLAKFKKKLKKGEKYRFAIVGSSTSSEHFSDPHNEAERITVFAALEGIDRLFKFHTDAWRDLWESDIVIEGDEQVQKDIRFALYHLYSFSREGTAYSLSPMGLSGLGYNGHVFWDTELWMFPPLLILQPEIARSLLEYRFERLDAAKQNAFAHGYQGAMFPWESSDSGFEDTPVWALTGPFQHHISGCVAWACWKYFQVTKDKEWLETRGYPILKEVADFWVSRVEKNGPGHYDINNVIGANEWQENIDNNAFTNGMAITALRFATQAAMELGISPNAEWDEVADNIPILTFEDGTTKENATYKGEEIKQADVNLLAYPLTIISDEKQIKNDLAYYEKRMSPSGPAMGFSVLATLYARLGDSEKAYQIFTKSYQPNKLPPFGVLAETAGGTNPYFATGAGGMLQTILSGFGGLEITDNGIEQMKVGLPSKWKSITIKGIGMNEKTYEVKD